VTGRPVCPRRPGGARGGVRGWPRGWLSHC